MQTQRGMNASSDQLPFTFIRLASQPGNGAAHRGQVFLPQSMHIIEVAPQTCREAHLLGDSAKLIININITVKPTGGTDPCTVRANWIPILMESEIGV